MRVRSRHIGLAVAAVTLAAVVGASAASASPTAPSKPTASAPAVVKGEAPDKDAVVARVARSLHVDVRQLAAAVDHLKQSVGKGTGKAEAVAAFARELRVSVAQAERGLTQLSKVAEYRAGAKSGPVEVPAEVVTVLAAQLHVSADRARQVLRELEKIQGRDVVADPAFAAMARELGITPQRLEAALIATKQQVVGKLAKPAK